LHWPSERSGKLKPGLYQRLLSGKRKPKQKKSLNRHRFAESVLSTITSKAVKTYILIGLKEKWDFPKKKRNNERIPKGAKTGTYIFHDYGHERIITLKTHCTKTLTHV
jgi:hypothetical protein